MPKPLLAQKPQHSRERKRPTVPLGRLCPFTHRLCCWGNQGAALQTASPELSEGAGVKNRRVHVVLPCPGAVGPLAGLQAQGQGP